MQRSARIAAWLMVGLVAARVAPAIAGPDVSATSADTRPGRLLDVPYLSQTEDLCGGAAVAMVLRYWGAAQVYPDDFAALVDRDRAGIPADVLTAEIGRRGWQALPTRSDGTGVGWIRGHVDDGRPVVALIAVGASRYHYVVVVAATADRVVVHDPARAPFQVLTREAFDTAWAAAGRWAMLVLPGRTMSVTPAPAAGVRDAPAPAAASAESAPSACAGLVGEMVAAAKGGDLDAAAHGLQTAATLCPSVPAVWRELAGVRFLQSRWRDAAALAARATELDPADPSGWDLLATSQFLEGRSTEALRSWSRLGRPTVDVVRVAGSTRTRHPVIAGLVDLRPRSTLTPGRLARAARRLDELPSAASTALRYQPVGDGSAAVEAAVAERPIGPRGRLPVAAIVARAAIQRELRVEAASPTGSGELWSAAWRWWEHRPRLTFALAAPAPGPLPGIATIEGLWERASYAVSAERNGPHTVQQERRRAAAGLADWATGQTRWRAGAALDRWDEAAYLEFDGGLEHRLAGDRVVVGAELAAWFPAGGASHGFTRAGLAAAARSTAAPDRAAWRASAGIARTGPRAPFDLWSGAGIGLARAPLLRAHPLLSDGIVAGPVFGRGLAHVTVEHERPVAMLAAGRVGLAAFVDAAHAWRRATSGSAWHADAGLGVRIALPGRTGTLRLDLARGLRDRRRVLSLGWLAPWPGR